MSAADIAMFLEQFVGVTPSMHSRTWWKKIRHYWRQRCQIKSCSIILNRYKDVTTLDLEVLDALAVWYKW